MGIESRRVYRASHVVGTTVVSKTGEQLGVVEDVMIDLEDNVLAYAAISFGGFLGIGEKYFAVPWRLLELNHDARSMYLTFDVERQALKDAPGFDPSNWPDVANPDWRAEVDAFYHGDA